MEWSAITTKISEEFELEGCFLHHRDSDRWAGNRPSDAFQRYLDNLFASKESTYFQEIRFFKYSEPSAQGAARALRYLALIPIHLEKIEFQFLGLIYRSQNQLQELLKLRVLPMYLVFWLHQFAIESRLRRKQKSEALSRALDEKRLYAQQLEHKVKNLSQEIDKIKREGLSLDQRAKEMERLARERGEEYTRLAEAYQTLFADLEEMRREYMETAVGFDHAIYDLERERQALLARLGEAAPPPERPVAVWSERDAAASGEDAPGEGAEEAAALRRKVEFYRKRCIEQERRLKRFESEELLK